MWYQFLLQNLHFAINLTAALVMAACLWLYLDAWLMRRSLKDSLKISGFLLLSLSFLLHGISIDANTFSGLVPAVVDSWLFFLTRFGGYLLISLGIFLDPLQNRPHTQELTRDNYRTIIPFLPPFNLGLLLLGAKTALLPIGALSVAMLYLRRSTIGLENHLKKVALSFFLIALSELLSMQVLFRSTPYEQLFSLVAPFGPLWIIEHLVLLMGVLLLGSWVVGYLLKRIQSQLFMTFVSFIVIVFLATTIAFTFLLMGTVEREALNELETSAKVLQYSIESRQQEAYSNALFISQQPAVMAALIAKDRPQLSSLLEGLIISKKQSSIVVVDAKGIVMGRGEDKERVGDSLSDNSLIKRVLIDQPLTSLGSETSGLATSLVVSAAVPIKDDGEIIGAVLTSSMLDKAFLSGIKKATDLEAALFTDSTLSASTLTEANQGYLIGFKEQNPNIKKLVLQEGQSFSGSSTFLNKPFLVSFLPLKDHDNATIGMLMTGRQQLSLLSGAQRSIELTFLLTTILLLLSGIPAFLLSRSLAKQLK